ncbi:MAG TPA: hypothetical protein PL088_16555, partial [Spirochaetota bacterium]|nr:hypothetical protein [Spirochaetota bacterium]
MKRFDEICRKISNKTDGISEQDSRIVIDVYCSRERIERREQTVLDEQIVLCEAVDESRFSRIGVSHDRAPKRSIARFSDKLTMPADFIEFLFQCGDTAKDVAAVGFQH